MRRAQSKQSNTSKGRAVDPWARRARIAAVWLGLLLLFGSVSGFRCHCSLEEGRVSDAHTIAFLVWPQRIPGPPQEAFTPLKEVIHLEVDYEGVEPESEIRARWYYLGHQQKAGEESSGETRKLFNVALEVVEGSGAAYFAVHRKGNVWPTGPYEVVVELNDEEVKRVRFQISSRTRYELRVDGPELQSDSGAKPHPVFSVAAEKIFGRVAAINPQQGSRLRVMWHRQAPGEKDFSFYAESDEVIVDRSERFSFLLPQPKQGYCEGLYRMTLLLGGEKVARQRFRLQRSQKPARARGARAARAD